MKFMPGACLVAFAATVGLTGRCAAKPPDLPHNPTIIAAPQHADPAAPPSVSNWLDPEPIFQPQPAPKPTRHTVLSPVLRQAITTSLLFNVHPLLSLLPTEQIVAVCQGPSPEPVCGPVPEPIPCPPKADPASAPTCPYLRARPDRHACTVADPDVGRSVLENLQALEKAADGLARAKKLARAGRLNEAQEQLERVRKLCPGSSYEQRADQMIKQIIARRQAEAETYWAEEEELEEITPEPEDGGFSWLQGVNQFGLCWFDQLSEMGRTVTAIPCIEARLVRPVTLHFDGAPLGVVLDAIRAVTGVPYVMDANCIAQPVTIHVEQMPVRVALDTIVRPLGLDPVIEGNCVCFRAPGQSPKGEEACEEVKSPKMCGSACPKCEKLHAKHARKRKQQRVEKLMKACYAAIDEGQHDKAAKLARKAHRLDPQRVEGDPVVYKLDLLAEKEVPTAETTAPECPCAPHCPPSCEKSNNFPRSRRRSPTAVCRSSRTCRASTRASSPRWTRSWRRRTCTSR